MENLASSDKAHKMMVIASFQELVLNKPSREAILEKGRTGIRPGFGDTFFQKIWLNRYIMDRMLVKMSKISVLCLMMRRILQSKSISVSIIIKHFLYYIVIDLGFVYLSIFVRGLLIRISNLYMKKQMAGNSRILPNLEKSHRWWSTKDGKDFYTESMKGILSKITSSEIQSCAEDCVAHLRIMSDNEYTGSSLIHIYDPRMMKFAISCDEESSLEQGRKFCDTCCKHIEHASKYIKEASYYIKQDVGGANLEEKF